MNQQINKDQYQFERMEIYQGLSIIRIKLINAVIGYVNFHPFKSKWFYFIKEFVSEPFQTEEDAIEALIIHFYSVKMDKISQKTENNDLLKN